MSRRPSPETVTVPVGIPLATPIRSRRTSPDVGTPLAIPIRSRRTSPESVEKAWPPPRTPLNTPLPTAPPIRMSSLQPSRKDTRLHPQKNKTKDARQRDWHIQNMLANARGSGIVRPSDMGKISKTNAQRRTHTYQMVAVGLFVVLVAMIIIWQVTR